MPRKSGHDPEAYARAYYIKNREKLREKRKKYREKHRGEIRERDRVYRKKYRKKLFDVSMSLTEFEEEREQLNANRISQFLRGIIEKAPQRIGVVRCVKVKSGKCWEVETGNANISPICLEWMPRLGALRVYMKDRVYLGQQHYRWIYIQDKFLKVLPVGTVASAIKRDRRTLETWMRVGLVPHVLDRNGKCWIPDFVYRKLMATDKGERSWEFRKVLEKTFVKGVLYVE